MRNLTLNETLSVNGAGFAEDVTLAASTIIVGAAVATVGGYLGGVLGFGFAALSPQPFRGLITAVGGLTGAGLSLALGGQYVQTAYFPDTMSLEAVDMWKAIFKLA